MHKVLFLNLPVEHPYYFTEFEKVKIKFNIGIELNHLMPGDPMDAVNKKIDQSTVLVMSSYDALDYYKEDLDQYVISWIKDGGSAIKFLDLNASILQNSFLSQFGMSNPAIKLRPIYGFDVEFEKSPYTFRDRPLFRNVNKVTLTQPNKVYFEENIAEPILFNENIVDYLVVDFFTSGKWTLAQMRFRQLLFGSMKKTKVDFWQ